MKNITGMIAVLLIVAGLCSGCDNDENAKPEKVSAAKTAEKDWTPETAEPAVHEHGANCDHDH